MSRFRVLYSIYFILTRPNEMSNYLCYSCQEAIPVDSNQKVDYRATCKSCKKDLHCCKNCKFYDTSAYNDCMETQAERVVDKSRNNFCEFFRFLEGSAQGKQSKDKTDALKKLDDLFK